MFESVKSLGWGAAHENTKLAKAIAELQGLKISLLAGAGAATAIAVTDIEPEDTVLSAIKNAAGTLTDITDSISIVDRRAQGTLTVADGIADGDKVVVNGRTYTFKALAVTPSANFAPGIVPFTLNDENGAAAMLAKVIMSADSSIVCTVVDNVVTVIWRATGVAGNAKTLSVADSGGHVTASGATLAGGTATNAIKSSGDTTGTQVVLFWYKKPTTSQV